MMSKQDEIREEREAAVLLIGIFLMVVPVAALVATCIYIPTLLFWGGYAVYAVGCVIVLAHDRVVKRGMLLSWQLGLTGDNCPYCREELKTITPIMLEIQQQNLKLIRDFKVLAESVRLIQYKLEELGKP